MTRTKRLARGAGGFLACFLLTFAMTAGSLFCLITAFAIPVQSELLLGCLAGASALATGLYAWRRGGWLALGLWVIGLGCLALFGMDALEQGARRVYTILTDTYAKAYSFMAAKPWRPRPGADATALLALWGTLTAFVCAWTIRRRQSIPAALVLVLLPLISCLVVVDTPPELFWLLLLLAAVCLFVLTQGCRRRSAWGGAALTLLLAIPCGLLVVGLQALLPQATYVRSDLGQKVLQELVDISSHFVAIDAELLGDLDIRVPVATSESLEIGPRRNDDRQVMEVQSSVEGALYLRGVTYGVYTGVSWEQIDGKLYPQTDLDDSFLVEASTAAELTIGKGYLLISQGIYDSKVGPARQNASVTIRTRRKLPVIYTPYYLLNLPVEGTPLRDVGIENTDGARRYEVPFCSGKQADVQPGVDSSDYVAFVHAQYTQLPEDTRRAAREIAEQWGVAQVPEEQLPNYLAELISQNARYDLNTAKMPGGSDFAIWFLRESDTGYCVHFASAAVVMLRAMDVPARYVTGYLVMGQAGEDTEVTEQNAHAWAEYYVDGVGWLPLEATPAGGVVQTMSPEEAPEETTEPEEETQPATESREVTRPAPTRPTADAEQTAPVTEPRTPVRLPGWLLPVLAAVAVFFLRRPVTLWLRRRKTAADPNLRFLKEWSRCCRLAKRLGQPEELRELALKARFSQHRLTPEELEPLAQWRARLLEALDKAPFRQRFLVRWILVWD